MHVWEFGNCARIGQFKPGVHYVVNFADVQVFRIFEDGGIKLEKEYKKDDHKAKWAEMVMIAMGTETCICTVKDDKDWIKDN